MESDNHLPIPVDESYVHQLIIDNGLALDSTQLTDLLGEIAATGSVTRSCQRHGMSPNTYLRARHAVPGLAKLHDMALEAYTDRLHLTIHQRAVEGMVKDVYYKGQVVGKERIYSDRLLELQLKRHDPAYRDKVEHDHQHGGGVLVIHAPATKQLTQEDWHAQAVQVPRLVEQTDDSEDEDQGNHGIGTSAEQPVGGHAEAGG